MPTSGSHSYDSERSRLRRSLEDQGLADDRADDLAALVLKKRESGSSPAAVSDRAGGPLGERDEAGDPGAVIELRSPAFSDGATMPPRFTKAGDNVAPALAWSHVPMGTVEQALLCEDRDGVGGPAVHWLLTGIGPDILALAEDAELPDVRTWPNSFGRRGYDGPMPPVGDDPHRYFFRLFALGRPLDLAPDTPVDAVRDALEQNHIATGTLMATF